MAKDTLNTVKEATDSNKLIESVASYVSAKLGVVVDDAVKKVIENQVKSTAAIGKVDKQIEGLVSALKEKEKPAKEIKSKDTLEDFYKKSLENQIKQTTLLGNIDKILAKAHESEGSESKGIAPAGEKSELEAKEEPKPVLIAGFTQEGLKAYKESLPEILDEALSKVSKTLAKKQDKGDGKQEGAGGLLGMLTSGLKFLAGGGLMIIGGLVAFVKGLMDDGPFKGLLKILSRIGIEGGIKVVEIGAQKVVNTVKKIVELPSAFFKEIVDKFPKIGSILEKFGPEKILETLKGKFESVVKFLTNKVQGFFNAFKNIATRIGGFFSGVGSSIVKILPKGGIIEKIMTMFKGVFAKFAGKSLTKIPIIGPVIGISFAVSRFLKGDVVGGLVDLASAIAAFFPGIGTAISFGIDALGMFLDAKAGEGTGAEKSAAKAGIIKDLMKSLGLKVISGIKMLPVIGPLLKAITHFTDGDWLKGFKQLAYILPPIEMIGGFLGDQETTVAGSVGKGIGSIFKTLTSWIYEKILDLPIIGDLIKGMQMMVSDPLKALKIIAQSIPIFGSLVSFFSGDDQVTEQDVAPKKSLFESFKDWIFEKIRKIWKSLGSVLRSLASRVLPDSVVNALNGGPEKESSLSAEGSSSKAPESDDDKKQAEKEEKKRKKQAEKEEKKRKKEEAAEAKRIADEEAAEAKRIADEEAAEKRKKALEAIKSKALSFFGFKTKTPDKQSSLSAEGAAPTAAEPDQTSTFTPGGPKPEVPEPNDNKRDISAIVSKPKEKVANNRREYDPQIVEWAKKYNTKNEIWENEPKAYAEWIEKHKSKGLPDAFAKNVARKSLEMSFLGAKATKTDKKSSLSNEGVAPSAAKPDQTPTFTPGGPKPEVPELNDNKQAVPAIVPEPIKEAVKADTKYSGAGADFGDSGPTLSKPQGGKGIDDPQIVEWAKKYNYKGEIFENEPEAYNKWIEKHKSKGLPDALAKNVARKSLEMSFNGAKAKLTGGETTVSGKKSETFKPGDSKPEIPEPNDNKQAIPAIVPEPIKEAIKADTKYSGAGADFDGSDKQSPKPKEKPAISRREYDPQIVEWAKKYNTKNEIWENEPKAYAEWIEKHKSKGLPEALAKNVARKSLETNFLGAKATKTDKENSVFTRAKTAIFTPGGPKPEVPEPNDNKQAIPAIVPEPIKEAVKADTKYSGSGADFDSSDKQSSSSIGGAAPIAAEPDDKPKPKPASGLTSDDPEIKAWAKKYTTPDDVWLNEREAYKKWIEKHKSKGLPDKIAKSAAEKSFKTNFLAAKAKVAGGETTITQGKPESNVFTPGNSKVSVPEPDDNKQIKPSVAPAIEKTPVSLKDQMVTAVSSKANSVANFLGKALGGNPKQSVVKIEGPMESLLTDIANNTGGTNQNIKGLITGFNALAKALEEKLGTPMPTVIPAPSQGPTIAQYAHQGNPEIVTFRNAVEKARPRGF